MHGTVSLVGEVVAVFSFRGIYRRATRSSEAQTSEQGNPLSPARGIIIAALLGVILWAGIIWLAVQVFGHLL